eukprot:1153154-Pelagomonas_calceolata.AAC.3
MRMQESWAAQACTALGRKEKLRKQRKLSLHQLMKGKHWLKRVGHLCNTVELFAAEMCACLQADNCCRRFKGRCAQACSVWASRWMLQPIHGSQAKHACAVVLE